ncbi:class C sortase [Corynebacterium callunae]|uniref:class C sortase n=1 Tax=Corynebacterium callunae TaxID=1721 RepID=UPI00398206BF
MSQHAAMVGASVAGGIEKMPRHVKRRKKSKRNLIIPWILQVGAMIGIAVLLYPTAADWFATRAHNAEISGYKQEIEQIPAQDLLKKRELAKEYNANIPAGLLQDPFSHTAAYESAKAESEYQNYRELLQVGGKESIGELVYSAVGISLPIFSGTDDEVLQKGVGHVYGSSLPVGGQSTHAVLTSHSGLVDASLFTKLFDAKTGDTFKVSVLGEELYYQVKSIETVLPAETESLKVVEGEDWLTLITCTPIGVNSHRLLVHAQRVDAPQVEFNNVIAGDGIVAGFPWWALVFCAGSGVAAFLIFAKSPHKAQGGRHRSQKLTKKVEL